MGARSHPGSDVVEDLDPAAVGGGADDVVGAGQAPRGGHLGDEGDRGVVEQLDVVGPSPSGEHRGRVEALAAQKASTPSHFDWPFGATVSEARPG